MDIFEKDKKTEEMCGLVEFHNDTLKILKYIDDIARENGIQYSTQGGTMIGQIRHKGFIPWDDDADIYMTRENFNKFVNVIDKYKNDDFRLLTPRSYNGDFVDMLHRVIYTKNKYKNVKGFDKYEVLSHCWVDILILDNCPKNKLLFEVHKLKIKGLYALLCSKKKIKLSLNINPIIKFGMFIFKILGKPFTLNFLLNRANKISQKYNHKNKYMDYLYCSNSMLDIDELVERKNLIKSTYLPFGDIKVQIYEGYDSMLRNTYGDYMIPMIDANKFIRHFDLAKASDKEIESFYKNN